MRPLQQTATTLRMQTPNGDVNLDPAADPAGYMQALMGSRDERVRQQRAAEDASTNLTAPDYAQTMINRGFNRAQEEGAQGPGGFNRSWVPFFESQNVIADNNNPGMKYKTDYGSLAENMPTSTSNLPTGYTDRRYGQELDAFARGGQAPGFTSDDTSARPGVQSRFVAEMKARLQPASLRALAKQGGY